MTNELIAIITAAVGLYLAISTRNKNEADTTESLTQAAGHVVEMQSRRILELETEIIKLKKAKRKSPTQK